MSQDHIPPLGGFSEDHLDAAFHQLAAEVEQSAKSLAGSEAVEQFRLQWLGRKQGRLKALSDAWLKTAPPEAKKLIGQRFNKLKDEIERQLESAGSGGVSLAELRAEAIDITLPGTRHALGAEHPLIKTMHEMVSGLSERMGYSVGVGPEVETDYYNFESPQLPPRPPRARHPGHPRPRQPGPQAPP